MEWSSYPTPSQEPLTGNSYRKSNMTPKGLLEEHRKLLRSELEKLKGKSFHAESPNSLSRTHILAEEQALMSRSLRNKIHDLSVEAESRSRRYEETSGENEKLKKENKKLKKELKSQIDYEEDERVKEQIIEALEDDNERLRKELEKSLDSLSKCQVELQIIPKIQYELTKNEKYNKEIQKELEIEKSNRVHIQAEKESLEIVFRNLKELTEGIDPFEFIQDLLTRLDKSNDELTQIYQILNTIEEKQKEKEIEDFENQESFEIDLSILVSFISNEFLEKADIPEIRNPIFNKLCTELIKLQKKLSNFAKEKSQSESDLETKIIKYEKTIKILKDKQDEVSEQIRNQEKLYYQLEHEREVFEEEAKEKEELLEEYQEKWDALEELVKGYSQNYSSEGVQTVEGIIKRLDQADRHVEALTDRCQTLTKELEDHFTSNETEISSYNATIKEYSNHIEEISKENFKISRTFNEQQEKLKEIIERYNSVLNEYKDMSIQLTLSENEKMKFEYESHEERKLVHILVQILLPTIKEQIDLVFEKRFCWNLVRKYEKTLKETYKFLKEFKEYKYEKPAIQKFRKSVICVIALNRLKKPTKSIIKYKKQKIPYWNEEISLPDFSDLSSNEQVLYEILHHFASEDHEALAWNLKLKFRFSNRKSLYSEFSEYLFDVKETIKRKSEEKDSLLKEMTQKLNAVTWEHEGFLAEHQEMEQKVVESQELVDRLKEMNKQILRFKDEIEYFQGKLEESERENEKLKESLEEMTEVQQELNKCTEILGEQREELLIDNQLKSEHILQLEAVIGRLEADFPIQTS